MQLPAPKSQFCSSWQSAGPVVALGKSRLAFGLADAFSGKVLSSILQPLAGLLVGASSRLSLWGVSYPGQVFMASSAFLTPSYQRRANVGCHNKLLKFAPFGRGTQLKLRPLAGRYG